MFSLCLSLISGALNPFGQMGICPTKSWLKKTTKQQKKMMVRKKKEKKKETTTKTAIRVLSVVAADPLHNPPSTPGRPTSTTPPLFNTFWPDQFFDVRHLCIFCIVACPESPSCFNQLASAPIAMTCKGGGEHASTSTDLTSHSLINPQ